MRFVVSFSQHGKVGKLLDEFSSDLGRSYLEKFDMLFCERFVEVFNDAVSADFCLETIPPLKPKKKLAYT